MQTWNRQRIFELLLASGEIARSRRRSLERELKADQTLVTAADREVESLIAGELEDPSAGVYFIGEETVGQKGADYVDRALREVAYVVDPIDGTAPFAHGLPHWAISIGRMEGGRLTDGAVYLPEMGYGEILASDGEAVLRATATDCKRIAEGRTWKWDEVAAPVADLGPESLICLSQDQAKQGHTTLANPVQVLGTAVYSIAGVLRGRFLAYVGNLKLWDVAGCLPLIHRLRYEALHYRGEPGGPLPLEVLAPHYVTDPSAASCWAVRGGLLVCPPGLETTLREAFTV